MGCISPLMIDSRNMIELKIAIKEKIEETKMIHENKIKQLTGNSLIINTINFTIIHSDSLEILENLEKNSHKLNTSKDFEELKNSILDYFNSIDKEDFLKSKKCKNKILQLYKKIE